MSASEAISSPDPISKSWIVVKVLVFRDFVPGLSKRAVPVFTNHLIINAEGKNHPVFHVDGLYFCYMQHADCYVVAVNDGDMNAVMAFAILRDLISVLDQFLQGFNSAKKLELNIITVMRILTACSTDGEVFDLSVSYLKNLAYPAIVFDISRNTGSVTSQKTNYRPTQEWSNKMLTIQKTYEPNTLDLTISEHADIVIDLTNNKIESCVVFGSIDAISRLSNYPEVTITLKNDLHISQLSSIHPQDRHGKVSTPQLQTQSSFVVELCDVRLHSSADLVKFHTTKKLIFTPTEEEFRLFSYRLNKIGVVPVLCSITNRSDPQKPLQREYQVRVETVYPSRVISRRIVISIPVMINIDSPKLQTRRGIMKYCPHEQAIKWIVESLPGKQIFKAILSFGVPSMSKDRLGQDITSLRPITIEYDIPYYQISSLEIDKCHVEAEYIPDITISKGSTGTVVIRHTMM